MAKLNILTLEKFARESDDALPLALTRVYPDLVDRVEAVKTALVETSKIAELR